MRARIKFTTDSVQDTLIGILKEHRWWPHFDQGSQQADQIKSDVRDSVEAGDVTLFDGTTKIILSHTATESKGTLSSEHDVWVLRLLNPNIHLLQLACETIVKELVSHAGRNHKKIAFEGPIQIVERKRKETIIEGQTLATALERRKYARDHRGVEFNISRIGVAVLIGLLLVTFPWTSRTARGQEDWVRWLLDVGEKFIGSVAVTSLISYVQYRAFRHALKEHTVRWSMPGEPEKRLVKAQSA